MENRTNVKDLKVGDRLSRVSYIEVTGKTTNGFTIKNQEGMVWGISKNIVQNEMYSANQSTEEKSVSRTEMVEALESAGDSIFTVVFDKKLNQKDLVATLQSLDTIPAKKTALNKLAKSMLAGQERTLIGYLASTEPKMGRSTVIDLTIDPTKHQQRLVDHRTIKELTLRNVHYTLRS